MHTEFRVRNLNMYALPQDTSVTCWAACAATLKAVKQGRAFTETEALPAAYRPWYTNARPVTLPEIRQVYQAMGIGEATLDLSSRPRLAQFIRQKAPIIIASALVNFAAGAPSHVGYHVRMIVGMWGDPDSANEDAFQVRIYDPSPPSGFNWETPFLFSHFRYQMTLRTGPVPEIVGKAWCY